MFKLGQMVKDKASGLNGALITMLVQSGGNVFYNFQPATLETEGGAPAERTWITADRIEGEEIPDPDLPRVVLGTEATDTITGFSGTVVGIILHMNGCIHLEIQPKGSNTKTGKMRPAYEFDIRMLRGEHVPKVADLAESRRRAPSPEPFVNPMNGR